MHRQAADLHAALSGKNHTKVRELFDGGGVHLNMAVEPSSTVRALHRAVFSGETLVVEVVLDQIPDKWPIAVKNEYLDVQTDGYTAYMIACDCGYVKIAQMLARKGCSTELTNN